MWRRVGRSGAQRHRSALALLALVSAIGLSGCSDAATPQAAGDVVTPAVTETQVNAPADILQRDEEITTVLKERADAIITRDRGGFTGGLDHPKSAFGLRQAAVFRSMSALRFSSFDYGTPEPAPALSAGRAAAVGPQATVIGLHARYTLAGFDRTPREFETSLTLVRRGDSWRIADDTDGGAQPQVWDLPDLRSVQSKTTLVVGNAPLTTLREYLALGDAAVARVAAVWPRAWGNQLVLVAPKTRNQMAVQLQQGEESVTQVAAVTDGSAGLDGATGSDRIVINPEAFGRLRSDGRRVVITHETTHVAVRRTTTMAVPIWLSEGFADYVGYGAVGVSRSTVASQLLQEVRAGNGPTALPSASDFDPAQGTIAPSYNAAYLAVSRMVDRYGEPAVTELYLTAGSRHEPTGEPSAQLAEAVETVLQTSIPALTDDWLAYLRQLAG